MSVEKTTQLRMAIMDPFDICSSRFGKFLGLWQFNQRIVGSFIFIVNIVAIFFDIEIRQSRTMIFVKVL